VQKNQVPHKLGALAAAARRAGIRVIHSPVGFDFDAMTGVRASSAIQRTIFGARLFSAGTPGADFIAEATPLGDDIVLAPRQGFSAFWAGTLAPRLSELGTTTLYIAGMLAEACVSSHARDATENGISPIVISDAIGSTSPELLDAACRELTLHTHQLETAEQAIASWAATAAA
jgi:nicotinamidase-related amidase